jgi:hypothetical protein
MTRSDISVSILILCRRQDMKDIKNILFWILLIIGLVLAGSEGLDGSPTVFNFIGAGLLMLGMLLCDNSNN